MGGFTEISLRQSGATRSVHVAANSCEWSDARSSRGEPNAEGEAEPDEEPEAEPEAELPFI